MMIDKDDNGGCVVIKEWVYLFIQDFLNFIDEVVVEVHEEMREEMREEDEWILLGVNGSQ